MTTSPRLRDGGSGIGGGAIGHEDWTDGGGNDAGGRTEPRVAAGAGADHATPCGVKDAGA